MSWGAVIVGGATLISGAMSSRSSKEAGKRAARATGGAISEQEQARLAFEERTEPFRQIGLAAVPELAELLGISLPSPREVNPEFTAIQDRIAATQDQISQLESGSPLIGTPKKEPALFDDLRALEGQLADTPEFLEADPTTPARDGRPALLEEVNPLVGFLRDEGFEDIQESAAAQGRLRSGGTLQDLTRFNLNLSSTVAPQLQQQRFNQLFSMLGLGSSAAAGQGAAGLNTASNISGLMQAAGQQQANTALQQGQIQANTIGQLAGVAGRFMPTSTTATTATPAAAPTTTPMATPQQFQTVSPGTRI